MKLTICSAALCRTPIFPFRVSIHEVWNELKTYIQESSPAFYDIIKDYESQQIHLLDQKARFTLWKYFNRARFRATPYGKFAAFSYVPVNRAEAPEGIKLIREPLIHRFADWSEKESINMSVKWLAKNANYIRANTTAYICGEELRYVNIVESVFELSAIEAQQLAILVLQFCHTKRTPKEVHDFLSIESGLSKAIAAYFLEQLIDLQLLLTDLHPNITGEDYFARLGYTLPEKANDYIIAERKIAAGYVNEGSLKIIIELTNFLRSHLPSKQHRSLVDFRDKFSARYENREIPLLTALDPEIGISYISLEQDKDENDLIAGLKKYRKQATAGTEQQLTPLHRFMINQMMEQKPVQLSDFQGTRIEDPLPTANTINIMVQHADELLIVKQIGGATANALLGRFSMVSEEVTQLNKGFSNTEQNANPDVLFFDIAYQAEKHVDNVNRRKSIYGYELPLLTWSDSDNIIDPDDVTIAVINGELVLRSVRYGKRIIPKLASAYNYTRSDLSIFRFLSDLQHQGLHPSLSATLDTVLPGLSHYPRIQYKNVVLAPARWLVPDALCNTQKDLPLESLSDWIDSIGRPKAFKCGLSDQTLCFDSQAEEDMISFLLYARNKTGLYIEEAFIPEYTIIRDEEEKHYLSEFIINLEHSEQLYQAYPAKVEKDKKTSVQDSFLPGGEWLYFEIYCHPSSSNSIINNSIRKCISKVNKRIKSWFFIRYNVPSNHIRFRLQLKPATDGYLMIDQFSVLLQPYLQSGLVSDIQIKTYHRENERYGAGRIHLVEECFWTNSEFVMSILKNEFQSHQLYAISISLMEIVWNSVGFSLQERLSFAEGIADSFAREMNVGAEGFKMINQAYKNFSAEQEVSFLQLRQKEKLTKSTALFTSVLKSCEKQEQYNMLGDLFHMHVNRLFHADQRMHEMIIYHFMVRILKIKIGREKNKAPANQL